MKQETEIRPECVLDTLPGEVMEVSVLNPGMPMYMARIGDASGNIVLVMGLDPVSRDYRWYSNSGTTKGSPLERLSMGGFSKSQDWNQMIRAAEKCSTYHPASADWQRAWAALGDKVQPSLPSPEVDL